MDTPPPVEPQAPLSSSEESIGPPIDSVQPIPTLPIPKWAGGIILLVVVIFILFQIVVPIFLVSGLMGGLYAIPPLLIFAIGIFYVLRYLRQGSRVKQYAAEHGLQYQGFSNTVGDGIIFTQTVYLTPQPTPSAMTTYCPWVLGGMSADRPFRIYETYVGPDQKNADTYDVMDTPLGKAGLRFLLVPKKNQGAIAQITTSLKKLQLEGDFGNYFDLFTYEGTEVEILQIFTPDLMSTLIDGFQEYTIELSPTRLYLYKYRAGSVEPTTVIDALISSSQLLQTKLFAAVERVDQGPGLEILTPKSQGSSVVQFYSVRAALVTTIVFTPLIGGLAYFLAKSEQPPTGYTKATHIQTLNVTPRKNCSGDKCNTSYDTTIRFTAQDGKSYSKTTNALLRDYSAPGADPNFYYQPQSPSTGEFVGGNTSKGAVHIVLGFGIFTLSLLWLSYIFFKIKGHSSSTRP